MPGCPFNAMSAALTHGWAGVARQQGSFWNIFAALPDKLPASGMILLFSKRYRRHFRLNAAF